MTTTFVDKLVCRFCGSATGIFLGHSSSVWSCPDTEACWQRERRQAEERERYEALGRAMEPLMSDVLAVIARAADKMPGDNWVRDLEQSARAALALLEVTT